MEKNKNGKQLLEILQENYEIETAQDLSSALKNMFKDALQEMMNAEFDTSMGYSKNDRKAEKTNYRNGTTKKKLKSEFGEIDFETPRDRNGEFEPILVPKNTRDISGIEEKIISLYGRGLSTREINEQIQDLYGIEVSATMVSNITDQIIPEIKEWQNRPLESVYPIVFIDAVHFSVRQDNQVVKKAAYVVLGVCKEFCVKGITPGKGLYSLNLNFLIKKDGHSYNESISSFNTLNLMILSLNNTFSIIDSFLI